MTGFQKYVQEKGYTDMTKLDEYLTEYLQTEECQQILTAWAEKNIHINGDVNITKEQLEKLSKELLEGYEAYVQETVTRIRRKWVSTLWIIWEQTARSRNFLQGL